MNICLLQPKINQQKLKYKTKTVNTYKQVSTVNF